jgi:hypothetical protein
LGDALQQVVEIVSGEGPVEGFADLVVASSNAARRSVICSKTVKSLGVTTFRWMMEKTISI